MKLLALALAAAFAAAMPALAGPQFVDSTGFAVSGFDVVAYRSLPQSQIGTAQPAPVPGRADITAEYNGATFAFATDANRAAFLANPAHYAPRFDGHCAYGVAQGGKVPGNPTLWRIVGDRLYLNITNNVVGFWEEDIPGNIKKAGSNWASIEPAAASASPIPDYTSSAPQKN